MNCPAAKQMQFHGPIFDGICFASSQFHLLFSFTQLLLQVSTFDIIEI